MKKTKYIAHFFLIVFVSLIIILLFILNEAMFLCLIGMVFLAAIAFYLREKWWAVIFIFMIAFLNRAVIACFINTPMRSDFLVYFESAQMFAQHKSYLDIKWAEEISNYWEISGQNNGIVIFYGFLLRICNHPLFLKFVNALLEAGTCFFIYIISKEIFDTKKGAIFSALLYAFYPFSVLYITVLSNQQSSLFFLMAGLTVILYKNKNILFRYFWGGVLIGLANVLRADVFLYVIVIIFCMILSMAIGKSSFKENIIQIMQLLIAYYGIIYICSALIIHTGINPVGLRFNEIWKFVVGLNIESRGKWSRELANCLEKGLITREYLLKEIKGVSVSDILILFYDKIKTFWIGNPNGWSIGHWTNQSLQRFIYEIDKWYWGIVLFAGGIGHIKILVKERFIDWHKSFFPIGVLCVSIVFLVIEVQERYRYAFTILFFIPIVYIYSDIWPVIKR